MKSEMGEASSINCRTGEIGNMDNYGMMIIKQFVCLLGYCGQTHPEHQAGQCDQQHNM